MPKFRYTANPTALEGRTCTLPLGEYLSKADARVTFKRVNFLYSLWYSHSFDDDFGTQGEIYIFGQKAALTRNDRDEYFVFILEPKFQTTINEVLVKFEKDTGITPIRVICNYPKP